MTVDFLPLERELVYGERVALAVAKDAAAQAFAQAERWKLRCFLAERELVDLGRANDAALERLETPTVLLEFLVDELEGQLHETAPTSLDQTTDPNLSTRRLTLALARERAQRQAAERALGEERVSHSKTRQLLAMAEATAQRARAPVPPAAVRTPRREGEPERRRQAAAAEAFASRLQLRSGFESIRAAAAGTVDVNVASLAWAHGSVVRAMRTIRSVNLARAIRTHSSLSGEYSRLREALLEWSRQSRAHTPRYEELG